MNKTLIVIALLIAQFTFSQDFKFGKVSKAELEEKQHPIEPNANAAVLYKNQDISFVYEQGAGFEQENLIHERIKIYNKDGYDYATKRIKLYNESLTTKDNLKGLKAYTYTLEKGKIVKTKLKSDAIFDEENNKYWKTTKLTMPNIQDGCIVEFKYIVKSTLLSIDDILFQKAIPINKFDFKVATPEYYKYKAMSNLKATYVPEFTVDKMYKKVMFKYTEAANSNKAVTRGTYGGEASRSETYTNEIDVAFNVITSNLENIPALKEEILVDNLSNYQARLKMELESINYPNQPVKSYASSWGEVAKTIYKSDDFGEQLSKNNYFKKDLDAILQGLNTPEEKIITIFNYVKSKVKWNNLYGYYTDLGVSKAYKEGSGNVADINLMLVAMLRHSGVEANPVLVSTKSNGIPLTATKNGFNYVIAAIELPEGIVLLDASSTYATANILPKHILNWQGRMIREDNSSTWVSLQPQQISKQISFLNATISEDLSITGKVREQLTSHLALLHRQEFNNKKDEVLIRDIEEGKGDLVVSSLEVKAAKQLLKPILISYEYNLQNGIEEIADKLYFSSLLFFTPEENLFKQETREYPIDFSFPVSQKYVINIKIPEGYQVESFPENEKFLFNGNDGVFTYLLNHKDNLLQITTNLDINKTIILPKDYLEFKKFFDLVVKKQTEQIVLKKV
jgi:hypothetical protein